MDESPLFNTLMHITTTIVTEVIKLMFHTTRAGLHPHWISSDEEEEEATEEKGSAMDFIQNDLYLPN